MTLFREFYMATEVSIPRVQLDGFHNANIVVAEQTTRWLKISINRTDTLAPAKNSGIKLSKTSEYSPPLLVVHIPFEQVLKKKSFVTSLKYYAFTICRYIRIKMADANFWFVALNCVVPSSSLNDSFPQIRRFK